MVQKMKVRVKPGMQSAQKTIKVVSCDQETITLQGLPYYLGITRCTAGSSGISMSLVVIPPGGSARPHYHRGYETAVYILSGEVETRFGEGLRDSVINRPGDFLYIPADLPHQPVNLSQDKPVKALVARNDANEQESVVLL